MNRLYDQRSLFPGLSCSVAPFFLSFGGPTKMVQAQKRIGSPILSFPGSLNNRVACFSPGILGSRHGHRDSGGRALCCSPRGSAGSPGRTHEREHTRGVPSVESKTSIQLAQNLCCLSLQLKSAPNQFKRKKQRNIGEKKTIVSR